MLQEGRTKVEWARWRHILYGFNTGPYNSDLTPWPNVLVKPLTVTFLPGARCVEELQGTHPELKNKPSQTKQDFVQISHGATRPL